MTCFQKTPCSDTKTPMGLSPRRAVEKWTAGDAALLAASQSAVREFARLARLPRETGARCGAEPSVSNNLW